MAKMKSFIREIMKANAKITSNKNDQYIVCSFWSCAFLARVHEKALSLFYQSKATITQCDLSATILFKLVDSYLIAFKFAQ